MIAYRATLDVPRKLAWFVAKMLLAERRRRGTPGPARTWSSTWAGCGPGPAWTRLRRPRCWKRL